MRRTVNSDQRLTACTISRRAVHGIVPSARPECAAGPARRTRRFDAGPVAHGLIAGMMLLGLCGVLTGCDQEGAANDARNKQQVVPVEVVKAAIIPVQESTTGIGTLRASETVELKPEISGVIACLHFEEGDSVEKGQLLYAIDDTELQRQRKARQAALEAAEARKTNAQWDFDRLQRLRERQAAAEEEYKEARDTLREASAEVKRLEREIRVLDERIADARISAPQHGHISESRVDPGDFVDIGQHLATFYADSPLELEFSVPERFVGRIAEGDPVEVTAPSQPGRSFQARVAFVAPAVDPGTRDLMIKAVMNDTDAGLKPGMFARAEVVLGRRDEHPVIPEECLVSTRTGYSVFVVRENKAHGRGVKIGLRMPGRVEVTEGVEPGDLVVRRGQMRLSDGKLVRLIKNPETQPSTSPADSTATAPAAQPATPSARRPKSAAQAIRR